MIEYRDALERVVKEVVEPSAREVDEKGTFPRSGVDALGAAGILGLTATSDVGGGGGSIADAAWVIQRLACACGSTAMVVLMHYAGVAVIEAYGSLEIRQRVGAGRYLTTLAFSEPGTRSHFWVSEGTALAQGDVVRLDAKKSWVTSAGEADGYVWSTGPLDVDAGPQTLWLVASGLPGLSQPGGFDGLGLRGNGSTPVTANGLEVPPQSMLGPDGDGLTIGLGMALPWFLVLSGAFCLGVMEAVTAETGRHLVSSRLTHLDEALIQQPVMRANFARMRLETDMVRTLIDDAVSAIGEGRDDAMVRALEVKGGAAEAAVRVTDAAMTLGGGTAFRKELGIERRFRDARAARVMAPTTDAVLDFIGRAIGGLPLFDA